MPNRKQPHDSSDGSVVIAEHNTVLPTYGNGDVVTPQYTSRGGAITTLMDVSGNSPAIETAGADGGSNTNNALSTKARMVGFNGTTWDRIRAGLTAITSSFIGFLNTIPFAIYYANPVTKTDGQGGPFTTDALHNLLVNLNVILNKRNDSITSAPEGGTPVNLTASGLVYTGQCKIVGFYVNSTNVGTLKLWDNTAGSGTVLNNTMTPAIGWHPLGHELTGTGLYATIGGTALDVTIVVLPL